MKFTPAKLFHAVVITGAALTGCAGSTKVTARPADNAAADTTKATTTDTAAPTTTNAASTGPGTCPPGSERPYPPCYWIK